MALNLGEKALQVLLESDALEFGEQGTQLELDLLVRQGRLDELRGKLSVDKDETEREKMAKDLNGTLGSGTYEMYRCLLALGEGDYKEADAFLAQAAEKGINSPGRLRALRQQLSLEGKEPGPGKGLTPRQLAAAGVAKTVMDMTPHSAPVAWLMLQRMLPRERFGLIQRAVEPLLREADYNTVRGLLAVEVGDIPRAKRLFREALYADKDYKDPPDAIFGASTVGLLGTPAGPGGLLASSALVGRTQKNPFTLDFPGLPLAYRYLLFLEEQEK
jgi:hypothetical protein